MSKILPKRRARVEEIAAAVVYLASPAAAMVTGTSLRVDGEPRSGSQLPWTAISA